MQVGDLVKVNERCDAGALWHKVGVVLGRAPRYEMARVRVFLDGRGRLLDYSALEVINENR